MKDSLIFAMVMLFSQTDINTFSQTIVCENVTNSNEPTEPINRPIHRSPQIQYISTYMDNGIYTLTFKKAYDNIEVYIYQNEVLIEQNVRSFEKGEVYYIDLQTYGKGEYTIVVYDNGNEILRASEEI